MYYLKQDVGCTIYNRVLGALKKYKVLGALSKNKVLGAVKCMRCFRIFMDTICTRQLHWEHYSS